MKSVCDGLARLGLSLMVLGPGFLINSTAIAQVPERQAPRAGGHQLAPPQQAVPLRPPPAGVRFSPPTPDENERTRKAGVVRDFGLSVPTRALGASIWLTPQNPYENASTFIHVADERQHAPDYAVTTGFPHGRLPVTVSPQVGRWWVGLRFTGTPFQYHLVECTVGGVNEYRARYLFVDPSNGRGANLEVVQRPGTGKAAFLLPPQVHHRSLLTIWGVAESGTWDFGGCEITPINPP